MKKLVSVFFLVYVLFASQFSLSASELISCKDLKGMVEVLDQLADALNDHGRIKEGSELDNALGDLVDALYEVANVEESKDLSASVGMLDDSWSENDWTTFKIALDGTINSIERIYYKDCK